MIECLIVGAGGCIGAICRYLIGLLPINMESGFPIKTFLINIAGSFLIGIIAALAAKNKLDARLVLFLKVGICGGFTTFSSFALESQSLLTEGHTLTAMIYMIASLVFGVLAVMLASSLVG